jgi:hypothetical protein
VLVLMVLVVCGTILVAAGRRSGEQAVRAVAAQRDLQLAWGTRSCQAALLPHAERLLRDRTKRDQSVLAETEETVQLGDLAFHVIVADESAKANVNATYHAVKLKLCRRRETRLVERTNDPAGRDYEPDELPGCSTLHQGKGEGATPVFYCQRVSWSAADEPGFAAKRRLLPPAASYALDLFPSRESTVRKQQQLR